MKSTGQHIATHHGLSAHLLEATVELDEAEAAVMGYTGPLFFTVQVDLHFLGDLYGKALKNKSHASTLGDGAVRVQLDRSKCRPVRVRDAAGGG